MVRIPLIKRQPKSDSSQGEVGKGKDSKSKDGKKTPPLSSEVHYRGLQAPPGKDEDGCQYVIGTDKKIPLPTKTQKQEVTQAQTSTVIEKKSISLTLPESRPESQPADAAFVARIRVPESRPEPPEVTETPEAAIDEVAPVPEVPPEEKAEETPVEEAVAEDAPSPASVSHEDEAERPAADGVDPETADALAMLQAMPDHIFWIGADGVHPIARNGSSAVAVAASGAIGSEGSPDGKAAADEAEKSKRLEKSIRDELERQNGPHARKVLETKQLQTFEFQIRDDKEVHHLEVRLTPFRETEVLALVRDVTVLRQIHNALIESKNELENHLRERNAEMMRVNKMLKTEVELREEQEEVLKKNFRKLEGLLDDTIGAITLIVEQRDPHIADHQRRVCQLACAIAQEMHSRNDRMRAVRMAAQLHDLGKIFIPAEILRKPGKLTEAEMSVVRTHPDTDYQILKRINFPISIADVVRQHHERVNGSGYPQGLKGDDILIEARIIAVADVIEGMVFERPYRVAPGLEAALKEIGDNRGTLYDPAVADACLRLFAEKRFEFESPPGQEKPVSIGLVSDHRDV
ncbi:MAG: HD domain-containing protein [Dehalococcoidia bacterium]|nr:HD domain-containing protein [Dehalococcoidia bacterium]